MSKLENEVYFEFDLHTIQMALFTDNDIKDLRDICLWCVRSYSISMGTETHITLLLGHGRYFVIE